MKHGLGSVLTRCIKLLPEDSDLRYPVHIHRSVKKVLQASVNPELEPIREFREHLKETRDRMEAELAKKSNVDDLFGDLI